MNDRGAPPPFPERIGRYDLLLPIAAGGMGAVYLARVTGIGGFQREVALKLMHAHLKLDPALSHHLIQEANLAVRIRHANVVSVIDVGDDPFGIYLVMDYVEGDTLSAVQRLAAANGKLPLRIGMKILLDSLAGLHAAHELRDEKGDLIGLVHRDFSPQNVLVGMDGVGRLTDFGIAKAQGDGTTTTGIVKGKIGYMSPEQARGEKVDRRADVWAAGVVAWQLVAERRLYPGKINEAATLLKVATQVPPRVRHVRPDAPIELEEVIAKALTMDVEKRWPTALAFRQALTAACQKLGEVADTEEASAYVRTLVEPLVNERRSRAKEISALRAKMGQLAETSTSSSDSSSPVFADHKHPEKQPASTTEVAPLEHEVSLGSLASALEPTRTDSTSVSDSTPAAKRRPRWIPFAAGGAVLVVGIGALLFASKSANDAPAAITSAVDSHSAAAAAVDSAPAAPPLTATQAVVPAPTESSSTPSASATSKSHAPPLLHAHAHPTKGSSLLPASPYDGHP